MPPDQLPSQLERPYYQPQAPGPQPMAPPPLPPQAPRPTTVRKDTSSTVSTAYLVICIVGIVILAIGALYGASGSLSTVDWDHRQDIMVYGRMVMILGGMILSVGLLAAGFASKDLSPRNRSSLFIVAVVVLIMLLLWPYG